MKLVFWSLFSFALANAAMAFDETAQWLRPDGPFRSIEDEKFVTEFRVDGAKRTKVRWVFDYLDLNLPRPLNARQLIKIRQKLITTNIFRSVDLHLEPISADNYRLVITIDEKWTTIPVIRAAYGGGTPLTVFGLYDTHGFGQLWTFGAETRKYGDAPRGGVIWARAPRWHRGNHVLGLELWRDNRIRDVWEDEDKRLGHFLMQGDKFRLLFLGPIVGRTQAGFDLESIRLKPTMYQPARGNPTPDTIAQVRLNDRSSQMNRIKGKLIYDNIIQSQLNMHGTRAIFSTGPASTGGATYAITELELFYYHLLHTDLTFAYHHFIGAAAGSDLPNIYFLGGFESIRGYPDGFLFGNKSAYLNLEMRHVSWKFSDLHIQNTVFLDAGTAGFDWNGSKKSSAGFGMRFSVPSVYRFVIRLDFARSLSDPDTYGISAGMNQFFQPYRPL